MRQALAAADSATALYLYCWLLLLFALLLICAILNSAIPLVVSVDDVLWSPGGVWCSLEAHGGALAPLHGARWWLTSAAVGVAFPPTICTTRLPSGGTRRASGGWVEARPARVLRCCS